MCPTTTSTANTKPAYSIDLCASSNRLDKLKPINDAQRKNTIFLFVVFFVAINTETNAMLRNRNLKIGLLIKLAPRVTSSGVAMQCTKQIAEFAMPIKSALLYFFKNIKFF